tara:strand:+ start:781 stop:1161 length:381 start_codon:yes stop_codon:yes gene_type:complete
MKQNQQPTEECTLKFISKLDKLHCSPVAGEDKYVLTKPFRFGGYTIPKGYKWDGATIPQIFWSLVGSPFQPKFMKASLVHDFLYYRKDITAKCNDQTFRKVLLLDGVGKVKATVMYSAVRLYRIGK